MFKNMARHKKEIILINNTLLVRTLGKNYAELQLVL